MARRVARIVGEEGGMALAQIRQDRQHSAQVLAQRRLGPVGIARGDCVHDLAVGLQQLRQEPTAKAGC